MPIEVFDYRRDIRNVLVTPAMRGRFLRHEPGEVGPFHSHDVGEEIFLILEGRCEFTIDGEVAVLGPGELCVARPHQRHQVRVVGEEPMTMFLAVAPHLEPTHTFWDADGNRLPTVYNQTTSAEFAAVTDRLPLGEQVAELQARLANVVAAARSAEVTLDGVAGELMDGDAGTSSGLDALQTIIGELHTQLFAMDEVWNEVTAVVDRASIEAANRDAR